MRDIRSRKAPKLYAANNTEIKVLGEVKLQIAYGGKRTKETVVICDTEKCAAIIPKRRRQPFRWSNARQVEEDKEVYEEINSIQVNAISSKSPKI